MEEITTLEGYGRTAAGQGTIGGLQKPLSEESQVADSIFNGAWYPQETSLQT